MREPALPWTGSCRCAQVKFEITAPPLLTMACHCKGCQRMTASAFSLSVAVPSEGFALRAGEPVIGGLHGPSRHYCCPHCMSWMFTRPEGMDFFVNVRATLLDDPSWFEPFLETWTSEKLPWAATPAVHSYAALPEMATYQSLIAEYASRARGPS